MSLLNTMKKVAGQTQDYSTPTAFFYGEVVQASPLKIKVDNRFVISERAIVLTREFRAGVYQTHTHRVSPHVHAVPGHTTQTGGSPGHSHGVAQQDTGETGLITATGTEVYAGLQQGDKVVLLRNNGGQSFLVLGRI